MTERGRRRPAPWPPRRLLQGCAVLAAAAAVPGCDAALGLVHRRSASLNASAWGAERLEPLGGARWALAAAAKPKIKTKLRGLFGGGDIVENEDSPMEARSARCGESFPAPERGSTVCPSVCPYMRYDADKVCHWKCITEWQCLHDSNEPLGVPNSKTGMCTVCKVAGCERCGDTENICLACKDGFDDVSGKCLPQSRHLWRLLYAAILAIVVLVLIWLLMLPWRPAVNRETLKEALLHRSLSKVRHEDDNHKLYSLRTDLCTEFIPSGGVGIMLHFRFERMALLWSVLITAVMGGVAFMYSQLEAADLFATAPTHDDALVACNRLEEEDEIALEEMRVAFLVATGIVYGLSTVGVVLFAIAQRRKYVEMDEKTGTMEDFALCCEGFPAETWGSSIQAVEGTPSLEDQYVEFFRRTWGDCVLGVSIVWDTEAMQEEINDLLQVTSGRLEVTRGHHDTRQAALQGITPRVPVTDDMEARPSRLAAVSQHVTRAPHRLCRLDVEAILLGESPLGDSGGSRLHRDHTEDEVKMLLDLKTTGSVFVVFNTRNDLDTAKATPLPKFRGQYDINVQHLECDAATVLWDGFSTTFGTRVKLTLKGIAWLLVVMVVWACCFYGPYAYYVLSWSKIAGASQGMADWSGFLQNTLLGLVITAGNQIVYTVCSNTAEQCKFTSRDARDTLSVVLYTFAVTINTVLDLALVSVMAHGWQQDTGLDEEALIRNPSMQHALFTQLVSYIYPGTILLPFLIEPLATVTIPFYLFMWLIRSRPEVDRLHAEELMVCPPFDLNRYGDIIINMALCALIFFLTSVNIWWIFAQLITSSLVIYMWDRYKYMRESQRTMFATEQMDICGQYLMVLPCSILAGAFAFKYQGGQAMVRGWNRHEFLTLRVEWIIVVLAMIAHAVLHTLAIKYLVPCFVQEPGCETDTYADVAKRISCNWFNANPGQCLRSYYHFAHDPPHVLDVAGKGHLHRKNEAIHCYYEAPEFEEEHSLFQEAMAEVVRTLDYVREEASLTLAHLKSSVESLVSSTSPSRRRSSASADP